MSNAFTLEAQTRTDLGKGASRRLRRLDNKVIGIVYGGKQKKPTPITLAANELAKAVQNEAFFTSLIKLSIDGKEEQVVVKDMQRHPAKDFVMHIDLLRISAKTKITMHVPLHFVNADTSPGVKLQGGTAAMAMNDIEISCLPKDLPEFIEVDMGTLNAGENLHISDLELPKGVESVALVHGEDHDLLLCSVNQPRGVQADDEDGEDAAADSEEAGEE